MSESKVPLGETQPAAVMGIAESLSPKQANAWQPLVRPHAAGIVARTCDGKLRPLFGRRAVDLLAVVCDRVSVRPMNLAGILSLRELNFSDRS